MVSYGVIVTMIVTLLVVGAIWYTLWGHGRLGDTVIEIKDSIVSVGKKFLDIGVGAPPSQLTTLEAPKEIKDSFSDIVEKLKKYNYNPDQRCLIPYKVFPAQDCMMSFSYDKGMAIEVLCKGEHERYIQVLYSPSSEMDLEPCVVGGISNATDNKALREFNAADNFYYNWLSGEPKQGNEIKWPEEVTMNMLDILWEGTDYNEPAINTFYGTFDLEDGGILYKADNNHICFFPTFDGDILGICNSNEEGLDDDCIDEIKQTVPYCNDYSVKTRNLGYISEQLPDSGGNSFVAGVTVVYFDVPAVANYVTTKVPYPYFSDYFDAYVKEKKSGLNAHEMSIFLREQLNSELSYIIGLKSGIKEIMLTDAKIVPTDNALFLEGLSNIDRNDAEHALESFAKIISDYPESAYAAEALSKTSEVYDAHMTDYAYAALDWYMDFVDNAGYAASYPALLGHSKEKIKEICGKFTAPTQLVERCAGLDKTKYYPEVEA